MTISNWTEADSTRAKEAWADYQCHHDLSSRMGQTVGIDPDSGRVWLGRSIQDVIRQRNADGCKTALYFVRVGSTTYYRKGGHR